MARPPFRLALAAVGLTALAAPGHAQCGLDDSLSGPCWDPSTLTLPTFPDVASPAAGLCWTDCVPAPKDATQLFLSPPAPIQCGQFISQVSVFDSAGAPAMDGLATLDYTRTWFENTGGGTSYQVWRLLLKVDLQRLGTAATCWIPPCTGTPFGYPTGFWYGYVDYAQDCVSGAWESSVVMYHACDAFIHNTFLSDRPVTTATGPFHPNSFYALVAPDTPANPFDPTGAALPRSGSILYDSVRNVGNPASPGACTKKERISSGTLDLIGQACLCPLAPSTRQSASRYQGFGSCADVTGVPSSWLSLNLFNPTAGFLWYEMIGTSLGRWTTPATYPGPEAVALEEGFFVYHDSCAAAAGTPADTLDFFYGAKTLGGYAADSIDGVALDDFVDLASNYSAPSVSLPMMGSVRPTAHLIYANVF